MVLSIAWRNIWRNKARSLVIILAIMIGLFGGVFSASFTAGLSEQRVREEIRYQLGNIQIQNPQFLLNNEIKYTLEDAMNLEESIAKIPGVKAVSSRLQSSAVITSAQNGTGVLIQGIDVAKDTLVCPLNERIVNGSFLPESDISLIVIGQGLADFLKVRVNSRLVLTFTNLKGEIINTGLKVAGIFKTNSDVFDKTQVFVPKHIMQEQLGFHANQSGELIVSLDQDERTNSIAQQIRNQFPQRIYNKEMMVRTWDQVDPSLSTLVQFSDFFTYIFLVVIFIALAFGIVNTMLMVVLERTRELGMLKAIGMNNGKVFRMIIWETVLLSFLGGLLGILSCIFVIGYFGHEGIRLDLVSKGLNALGYSAVVYPDLSQELLWVTFALVLITSLGAAIYPATKAVKLNPSESIRTQA